VRSMEKINYFPMMLSSWAADNITFFDAAGRNLASKPIFMRTMVNPTTPAQQRLYDRTASQLAAPSAFPFVIHGYDAVQLVAAAIRQAGSTEGPKVREALENLNAPVQGVKKTYNKPFSKDQREALIAADLAFVKWEGDKLVQHNDAVIRSLTAGDFKR
jgi:branched-chain amino acid transport system substrate-binding protein